jgi:hypothetical protein
MLEPTTKQWSYSKIHRNFSLADFQKLSCFGKKKII